MKALRIYAGPRAREHIARARPAAAGRAHDPRRGGRAQGPDPRAARPLPLRRLAAAVDAAGRPGRRLDRRVAAGQCLPATTPEPRSSSSSTTTSTSTSKCPPGQKRLSARQVSEQFGEGLRSFYGGRIGGGAGASALPAARDHLARPAHPRARRARRARRSATWAPSSPTACTARAWAPGWSAWCSRRRARRCLSARATSARARST